MSFRKNILLAAGAVLLGVAGLTGCKSDSTGPTNNDVVTDAIVAPKQGSTYTFATYDTDSLGNKVSGSDRTVIYTVADANLTIGGKSNALKFVSDAGDTGIVHYESNGDVSIYQGTPETGAAVSSYSWITIPFGSRATQNTTLLDTTINDPSSGISGHAKLTSQTVASGTETVTVGSESLKGNKGTWKIDATLPLGPLSITSSTSSTMTFVPKLGFWVKETTTSTSSFGLGASTSGEVSTLTSYSLK